MIKKFNQLKQWIATKVSTLKEWLSEELPIPADDKIMHYTVVKYLSLPVTLLGMFAPKYGIIGLLTLLVGAALWELPQLFAQSFSRASVREAIADWVMAFKAVFVGLVMLTYIYTTISS